MAEQGKQENERYDELNGMVAFSLGDIAEEIGVSKGYISRRVGEEKDVRGYPVFEWAVRDGAGRVDHYRVPATAFEENEENEETASENTATADTDQDTVTPKADVRSIREVARAGRKRREEAQAKRDREQLEADRQRVKRAKQRRENRRKERREGHTYTVCEMADVLDTDAATVRKAVADGRDVRAFPVGDFAVTNENGDLMGFRVPVDAFDSQTMPIDAESSRETSDPGSTQPDTPVRERSGAGGFLALGAATIASIGLGALGNE